MNRIFTASCAIIAIAVASTAPAHASGFGGGLHGGFGGGLGGGFGGGLPIGSIHGTGDIGVNGTIDGTTDRAHSATRDSHPEHAPAKTPVKTSAKAPALAAPGVNKTVVMSAKASAMAVPTVNRTVVMAARVPVSRTVAFVPAIPDLAVRRTAVVEAGIAPVAYAEVPAYVDQQYTVLQDELRGTGVRVSKQGQQIVLEMPSDVTFSFNKYDIQPRFYGVLDAVSHTLAKYPATYVDVNGHTDAIGSYSYNQVLSEKRADSVADFLAARDVNPARLHVQGFGKTEPIASNATIDGRAANRRVEIVLTPYAA